MRKAGPRKEGSGPGSPTLRLWDAWRGPGPSPASHRPLSLPPPPREILGLVDVVALENGELGPLLSAGTLRGLEDECVTDVKVPPKWFTWDGEGLCRKREVTRAWKAAPCPLAVPLFPVVT